MVKKVAVSLLVALVMGACTSVVRNEASCYDNQCLDPARPYCDVDGTFGGEPGTCIAVTCQPDQLVRCNGDMALVCNSTGDNIESTDCGHACDPELACAECVANTSSCDGNNVIRCGADARLDAPEECEAGCVPGATARCAYLEPRYVPDACDVLAASSELRFDTDTTFDTNDDANCNGGIVEQLNGPSLCVVRHGRIAIEENANVRVTGLRTLAFVADSEVVVRGALDLSASKSLSGPGASDLGVTKAESGTADGGGGGAGGATTGAAGGGCCAGAVGGGGAGGSSSVRPSSLGFLRGAPMATRWLAFTSPTNGGGGGGAATLIACRGAVTIESTGRLSANGGGGSGARVDALPTGNTFVPAGGGGGGGAFVLQALSVRIEGALFANGGSGGAGKSTSTTTPGRAADGVDGPNSVMPAIGAIGVQGAGSGGNGGFGGVAPTRGTSSTSSMMTGGGGGGSVGFFEVVAPANGLVSIVPSAASPPVLPVVRAATR